MSRNAARKSPKIASWLIRAFRGIPGEQVVHLDQAQAWSSALILGDNGSGKSSIVDALEFALQSKRSGEEAAAWALNAGTEELASVEVRLTDGTTVLREVHADAEDPTKLTVRGRASPAFSRTPLIIRRADILRFWETPASQRQTIFVRYFSAGEGRGRETPKEIETRLDAERIRAKTRRNDALRKVARVAEVPTSEVPTDPTRFSYWVNNRFYGGWDKEQKRLRDSRRLPPAQYAVIKEARDAVSGLKKVTERLDKARRYTASIPAEPELATVLTEASEATTKAFRAISPSSPVDRFEMQVGQETAVAMGITATLTNGRTVDPATVLSEANRDLLALLIFVSIARAAAERGQAGVIVLDDVFQSVDAPIRVAALDYPLRELKGWQLVITAHDRLWSEQVKATFGGSALTSLEIVRWSLDGGPEVRGDSGDASAGLRGSLEQGVPALIALQAGRLLELTADVMSWTLGVSIKRQRGDRYSLGALWDGTSAILKTTNVAETVEEVDRFLHLRNLLGAHVNDWATVASLTEAERFGTAVLNLYEGVHCTSCNRWIEDSPVRRTWVCRCGSTTLVKTKAG